MFESNEELFITIVASSFLLVIFVVITVLAILRYQYRQRKHMDEMNTLKEANQREMLKAQLEMQEMTFHTISQEIHDNVGQILSLAKLNLNTIAVSKDIQQRDKIITTKDLIGKAIQDLRNISKTLNTKYIEDQSIDDMIALELEMIGKTGVINVQKELRGVPAKLPPQQRLILFRIIQEVFHNVLKHAKANRLILQIDYTNSHVVVKISDDGVGFMPIAMQQGKNGTGLRNLHHRAKLIGAQLEIESEPGEGTQVCIKTPLNFQMQHG